MRFFNVLVGSTTGWIDFFTDGSCLDPGNPALSLASWAAVSATHGQVLASGPLVGLQQDNGERCQEYLVGLHCLLEDSSYTDFDTNEDLWLLASGFLDGISANGFRVQHINSHLADALRDDPVDDWLAFWNDAADHNANLAHAQRPEDCMHICQLFRQHHLASEQDVDKLRDLHLAIGHLRGTLVSGR